MLTALEALNKGRILEYVWDRYGILLKPHMLICIADRFQDHPVGKKTHHIERPEQWASTWLHNRMAEYDIFEMKSSRQEPVDPCPRIFWTLHWPWEPGLPIPYTRVHLLPEDTLQ